MVDRLAAIWQFLLEELTALRESSQEVLVESMRRDQDDAVSTVLLEACDSAHPDKKAATRERIFRSGRAPEAPGRRACKPRSGRPTGGQFRHVQAHKHCSGSTRCCRIHGSTESGAISVEGSKLIFRIEASSQMVKDDCTPSANMQSEGRAARGFVSVVVADQQHWPQKGIALLEPRS
jgi:hypothetical protein